MRLLIATGLYPPEIGGPATYTKLLEEELPKYGIQVGVLPFRDVRKYPRFLRHLIYLFLLFKYGSKADIIYAQDTVSVGFPSLVASFVMRKKFFVRVPGDYAWEQASQKNKVTDTLDVFSKKDDYGFPVMVLKFLQRTTARGAYRVITPSRYMKKIVVNWGVSKKKVRAIYNPVRSTGVLGNRATIRGLIRFDGVLITSVGRLVPWKGFDTLIEILPDIRKKVPNTKLFIIGDGPDLERLEKLAQTRGVRDEVIFGGRLEREVLMRYLYASDAFVLNTGFESFAFQMLEAMQAEVPVVTTRVGSIPEIVEDRKNGILVKKDNKKELTKAVLEVLQNKKTARGLVREGLKTVERFRPEIVLYELIQVMREK